jgi:uncharacterized membrane protein
MADKQSKIEILKSVAPMSNSGKSSRPILKIERSPIETILDVVAIAGIVVSLIIVISSWGSLPEKVPMHFDFSGKVTSYSSKNSLWILPLSSIFSYFLLKIVSRYPKMRQPSIA